MRRGEKMRARARFVNEENAVVALLSMTMEVAPSGARTLRCRAT
jgi:hypothetical protein